MFLERTNARGARPVLLLRRRFVYFRMTFLQNERPFRANRRRLDDVRQSLMLSRNMLKLFLRRMVPEGRRLVQNRRWLT